MPEPESSFGSLGWTGVGLAVLGGVTATDSVVGAAAQESLMLDPGLDIDALRDCARRVEAMSNEAPIHARPDAQPLGVLAITHYSRLLEELRPDVWLNLSRVAAMARRRGEAHRALCQGLERHPGHNGLARELRRMGVRRQPVLGFLPRSHPINVKLGRLRTVLLARR